MLTKRALNNMLIAFISDLEASGISTEKILLYGSYVKGNVHAYSDVDVAIWSKEFTGDGMTDFERIKPVLKKYPLVQAKLYPHFANENNYDPFIDQVKKTGISIV